MPERTDAIAPAPKRSAAKPVAGFAIVLAIAVGVGAWLYLDAARKDLEMKAAADAERAARTAADEAPLAPAAGTEEAPMFTYAAELDGHRFQIDLPEGSRLAMRTGPSGGAYAEVVSGPDDSEAGITIELLSAAGRPHVEDGAPGHRFVPTADGTARFWISGADFEERPLPGFEAIAASFKAL